MTTEWREVRIVIPVMPVAKGRPKFFKPPNADFGRAVTPAKTRKAEHVIQQFAIAQGVTPVIGPVHVSLDFRHEPPASTSKKRRRELVEQNQWRDKKPDLDNLIKTVLDALNEIAWADDKSVVSIFARKVYAERSETIVTVVSTEMPIPFF